MAILDFYVGVAGEHLNIMIGRAENH